MASTLWIPAFAGMTGWESGNGWGARAGMAGWESENGGVGEVWDEGAATVHFNLMSTRPRAC